MLVIQSVSYCISNDFKQIKTCRLMMALMVHWTGTLRYWVTNNFWNFSHAIYYSVNTKSKALIVLAKN